MGASIRKAWSWQGFILAVAAGWISGCSVEDGDGQIPPLPELAFAGFAEGDEVAVLELAAPSVSNFVLHGTLPVPQGLLVDTDGPSPFMLRDADGNEVKTQVEIVSRYADDADGADVLEVLAVVNRPAGASVGDRIEYTVLWSPNYPNDPQIDSAVQTLIDTPEALTLRTTDVFGNIYDADLLADLRTDDPVELQHKRSGPVANQVRTYENLVPQVPMLGPTGTLAHMMGVHTYMTTWRNEGFISFELRVHNGHDGSNPSSDQDDPAGKLYFEELEIIAPSGWTLFQAYPTPSTGTSYNEGGDTVWPIVAPIGGGTMHMMPKQSMFHRRFVLCKTGQESAARAALAEEGLAFCRAGSNPDNVEYLSWWNSLSSRYFAQNVALPTLDFMETEAQSRSELSNYFDDVRGDLGAGTLGTWPIVVNAMGWAHPWGPSVGNMHGGAEIYFWDGVKTAWSASREGYRSFQVSHRMTTERHPTALYDDHGEEHQLEDWIAQGPDGPYLPIFVFGIPWLSLGDPWGFNSSPSFQRDAVVAQGRQPAYDAQLSSFEHIDFQHLIRYTRSPKVLVWLGNDALAKDDLFLSAELGRSSYSFLEQTTWGESIVTGAAADANYVAAHPGDGFVIDRGEGWLLDTAVAAYALQDTEWRNRVRPWFEDIVDLVEDGRSDCTGSIMSIPNPSHFGAQYRVLQSISESILQNALWGMRSSVFEDASPARHAQLGTILADSTAAMIGTEVWDPAAGAPHFYTALGPFDQDQAAFCNYVPFDGTEGHDGWQTWNLFVWGYRITGDPIYLTRATEMAGGTLTPANIGMDNLAGELENRVGILSLLQELD